MTIEIAVCEFVDGSFSGKKERGTFHVEVRFIPSPGAHSICFQGERHHDRAKAEAEKVYVESVFKDAVLKKPKAEKKSKRSGSR